MLEGVLSKRDQRLRLRLLVNSQPSSRTSFQSSQLEIPTGTNQGAKIQVEPGAIVKEVQGARQNVENASGPHILKLMLAAGVSLSLSPPLLLPQHSSGQQCMRPALDVGGDGASAFQDDGRLAGARTRQVQQVRLRGKQGQQTGDGHGGGPKARCGAQEAV